MIHVNLPDGTTRTLSDDVTALGLASDISKSFAKRAVGAVVNGGLSDLLATLPDGANVELIDRVDLRAFELIRHDLAHILLEAVQSLWPNTVQFSEDFYKALQKHALPVDVRALRAFSNSARKLDLLFWITYRITRLESKLILDWKPLKDQFGEGFSRERDFKAQLADDLASVLELFPKLPIKLTDRGLEMENADAKALAIPRRTTT